MSARHRSATFEESDRDHGATAELTNHRPTQVKPPSDVPGAARTGAAFGVAMLAVAAIAIRDLLVEIGWLNGRQWSHSATRWVAESSWHQWMWAVSAVAIAVGLAFLWQSVRPRRRRYIQLAGHEALWTRRGDIGRRCTSAVSALPGVARVETSVGRRKVKVTVEASGAHDTAAVRNAVEGVLSAVAVPLRASIKTVAPHVAEGERL